MWWRIAGGMGASGVALGAFGAHALEGAVTDPELMAIWRTASLYHLVHAVALLGVAAHPGSPKWAGRLFTLGIAIFSGSLYTLVLTDVRWLGAITPIGGTCLIAGWLTLIWTPHHA